MVGNFVKEHGVRDKVVIATKVVLPPQVRRDAAQAKAQFLKVFEGCLRRLQMDYVDILYFHGIDNAADVNAPGVQEAMADLKKQGKIRFLGVSTHSGQTEVLNAVAQGGFHDVVLVAINFTMSENKPLLEAIKNAAAKGVGLIAMKTQAGGQWYQGSRCFTTVHRNHPPDRRAQVGVAERSHHHGGSGRHQVRADRTGLLRRLESRIHARGETVPRRQERQGQPGVLPAMRRVRSLLPESSGHSHADADPHVRAAVREQLSGAVDVGGSARRRAAWMCADSCTSCRASCANTVNIARKISELKTVQFA